MESLVYEDSPLADYLEGEGERDQYWVPQEVSANANANTPQNFAPKGVPSLQNRARDIFAGKKGSLQEAGTGALDWLHRACSTAISSRIGKRENDRFLEQFGYVIVASHLLDEYNATSHTTAVAKDAAQSNVPVYGTASLSTAVGLSGSIITAATSFSIVALIHWSRSRTGAGFNPRRIVVLLVVLPLVGAVFCAFARRQWLKFVRHHAVHGASGFVDSAQRFDSLVSSSVLFIQEVELVSRGYRISTPLPPISRLEETAHVRRCMRLRRAVSESLSTVLERYIQAQHTIGLLTDPCNLEKYYDIYELSMEELAEARSASFEPVTEDQYSLKCLRVLFSRLYTVRKSILCCLLAIKADGCGSDIPPWTSAADEMRELATVTGEAANKIASILNEEDRTVAPLTPSASTGRDTLRAQARRLNSLSQGIRALHAKMHVMREESDESLTWDTSEPDIDASLMAQYESIGDDIRGLLQEWEAGKSALLSSLEQQQSSSSLTFNRSSRASSSSTNDLKLPLSPTSSLGGVTAVDGSPSAALMALNGETQTLNNFAVVDADAEEIFEAIVMPSSRKRQSLTREERIARVKEDRARQAAAREKTDANTNMLRELETVIKHRPQLRNKPQRITSI